MRCLSASWIPTRRRTVALTLYGDLDLSVLDEMPKGRKEIKTWLVPNAKREKSYEWIEKQVEQGDQIFIVCPFIEESENMTTVKAATKELERLQKEVFPHLKLAMHVLRYLKLSLGCGVVTSKSDNMSLKFMLMQIGVNV